MSLAVTLRNAAIRCSKYYDRGYFALYILDTKGLKLTVSPTVTRHKHLQYEAYVDWLTIDKIKDIQLEDMLVDIEAEAMHQMKKKVDDNESIYQGSIRQSLSSANS